MSDTITEVIADLRLAHLLLRFPENQGDAARLVHQSINSLTRLHASLEAASKHKRDRVQA